MDPRIEQVEKLLENLGIPFELHHHNAVFSTKDIREGPPLPGAHTKQLLFRAKRTDRYFLAIVMHDKQLDTRALAKILDVKELEFASAKNLMTLLRVESGSVTPFGLIFDVDKKIEILVDQDAWKVGLFQFHPLINTATVIIDANGLNIFLQSLGRTMNILTMPRKTKT